MQRPFGKPLPQQPQVFSHEVKIKLGKLGGLLFKIGEKLPVLVQPPTNVARTGMFCRRQGEFGGPRKEPHSGGARRGACADYSGLPGGQGDSTGCSGTGLLSRHRFQMAPALLSVGAERTTRPACGRVSRSGMTQRFSNGCWPCWRSHRRPACLTGTGRRRPRNSTPVFTPSGACRHVTELSNGSTPTPA